MISRNETIPECLTDQELQHIVDTDSGLEVERAKILLGVLPEYRQGVQARVWQLLTTCVYLPNGFVGHLNNNISLVDAFKRALSELAAQLAESSV